jgi:hypothetical protein
VRDDLVLHHLGQLDNYEATLVLCDVATAVNTDAHEKRGAA